VLCVISRADQAEEAAVRLKSNCLMDRLVRGSQASLGWLIHPDFQVPARLEPEAMSVRRP